MVPWAMGICTYQQDFTIEIDSRVVHYLCLIVCFDLIGINASMLWYEYHCLREVIYLFETHTPP